LPKADRGDTTGVIIPLYSYPGTDWEKVVRARVKNPEVPVVAIVNPNSGPGASPDPKYSSSIEKLRSAGTTVIGYTHTSYGRRPLEEIVREIESFLKWYKVEGIFFDEMSNQHGFESYYSKLNKLAKSRGCSLTIGNSGAPTPTSYFGTLDNLVVHEGEGIPTRAWLREAKKGYGSSKFSYISYGIFPLDVEAVARTLTEVRYLYVTDTRLPDVYCSLPTYFEMLVSGVNNAASISDFASLKAFHAFGSTQ
jgi:hypothetical protein